MKLPAKKIHYAWVMCATGFFVMVINMGFNGNLYATYLPFIEATGFSGTQGSMILTVKSFSGLLCTLFMGLFYKKFGLRFGIALSTFLGAVSMMIMARAKSIGVYYIASTLGGLPFALGSTVAASMLINNWFNTHRGVAFGITSAGSGLATCVLPPVTERFIRLYGLSRVFYWFGIIQLIASVLFFLLLRSKPEDIGELPYGSVAGKTTEESEPGRSGITPCRKSVTAMFLMFFIIGGAHAAATAHISVLGESTGYGSIIAARMFSVYGLVMAVTKLGFGEVSDRIGSFKAGVIALCIYVSAILPVLLLDGSSCLLCYLSCTLIGIGSGGYSMGLSLWTSDFSDRNSYSGMLKKFQLGNMGGSMVLSVLPGFIADMTGSYKIAYLFLSVLFTAGLLLLIFAYRAKASGTLQNS